MAMSIALYIEVEVRIMSEMQFFAFFAILVLF